MYVFIGCGVHAEIVKNLHRESVNYLHRCLRNSHIPHIHSEITIYCAALMWRKVHFRMVRGIRLCGENRFCYVTNRDVAYEYCLIDHVWLHVCVLAVILKPKTHKLMIIFNGWKPQHLHEA